MLSTTEYIDSISNVDAGSKRPTPKGSPQSSRFTNTTSGINSNNSDDDDDATVTNGSSIVKLGKL